MLQHLSARSRWLSLEVSKMVSRKRSFTPVMNLAFTLALVSFAFRFAYADQCSDLFRDTSAEFIVEWSSPRPLSFQNFKDIDQNAAKLGISIITQLEQESAGAEYARANPPFLTSFIMRGDSSNIAKLIEVIQIPHSRVEAFPSVESRSESRLEPSSVATSLSDISIEDFVEQKDSAIGSFFRSPQNGGAQYKILHLNKERSFYLLNPFWLGRAGVREIIRTMSGQNPNYPPITSEARHSLNAIIKGGTPNRESYIERSIWSVMNGSIIERLEEDHAKGVTIAFTEHVPATKLDDAKIRLRYVLVPIPIRVTAVPAPPQAVAPAPVASRAAYGPVITYTSFRNRRAATLDRDGLYSLKSVKLAAVKGYRQIGFLVVDPGFVFEMPADQIFRLIESRFPELATAATRHRAFFEAVKSGHLSGVNHLRLTSSELAHSEMRPRLNEALKLDEPIVIVNKSEPDRIKMILIPVGDPKKVPASPNKPAVKLEGGIPFTEGIGVAEFMLYRDRAIGPFGRQPLNKLNPVRILQKRKFGAYFYIVSAEYLRTAPPEALPALIERRYPTLPPLSREDIKFVSAMRKRKLPSVQHFTHMLGELSRQGANAFLETAWSQHIPIVAKKANADEHDAEYVLIPIGTSER